MVDDSIVRIQQSDLLELKGSRSTAATDSSFVSLLLGSVFTNDVLKQSSAGGRKSNYNGVSHNALERVKLKFIEG